MHTSESASWEASFTVLLIVKRGHGLYTSMSALDHTNKQIHKKKEAVCPKLVLRSCYCYYYTTTKTTSYFLYIFQLSVQYVVLPKIWTGMW